MNIHPRNIHNGRSRLASVGLRAVVALTLATTAAFTLTVPHTAFGQATQPAVPQVNLDSNFKLVICDGPPGINHWNPQTKELDLSMDSRGQFVYGPKPGFIPCNFEGLMIQVQFLINVMLVLGVLAALIGFAYAGYLHITGTKGNLDRARGIFPKVAWGFVIMLTAWFIVHQILVWLTGSSAYLQ